MTMDFIFGLVIGLAVGIIGGALVALLCAAKGRTREDGPRLIAILGYTFEGKQLYIIDGDIGYEQMQDGSEPENV